MLLLSKQSLKYAEAVIDIANDKIKVFGRDVDLYFSTSGHYCLDIFPIKFAANKVEEILILENDLTLPEKTSQITQIHKQFKHAKIVNMKKLLKNANLLNNEITKK